MNSSWSCSKRLRTWANVQWTLKYIQYANRNALRQACVHTATGLMRSKKRGRNSILMTGHHPDVLLIGRSKQKHFPDLDSVASSVWNFCARSQTSFGGETIGGVAYFPFVNRLQNSRFFFLKISKNRESVAWESYALEALEPHSVWLLVRTWIRKNTDCFAVYFVNGRCHFCKGRYHCW